MNIYICMTQHKKMLDTTVLISAKYQRSWLVSVIFFGNHSIHDLFFH